MSRSTLTRKRVATNKKAEFLVRPIRNHDAYEAAVEAMNALAVRPEGSLSSDDQDRLELLTLVVGDYDNKHFRIASRGKSPIELLKRLMAQNDLKPIDLAPILGGRPAVSLILSGKRKLSKSQIFSISKRFKIDPGVFLQDDVERRISTSRKTGRRVA